MNLKSHIVDLLKKIGLTESEACFYLEVNKNPQATIKDLQKKTGLSRASAYRSFERLKELKLITSSATNWRKNISAVSLKTLAQKLAGERLKLRKIELELKNLNNLLNLTNQNSNHDPVQIFTDQNDIVEKCYEIVNRPWEKMACYGSAERLVDVIGEKPERDFIKIRSKKGKKADALVTELGEFTRELIPRNYRDLRNMKLRIDKENQDYITYLYEDEVTIWHKDKALGNRAIVIHDPTMVKMYSQNFQNIWNRD